MAQSRVSEHPLCPSTTGDAQDPWIIGFIGADGTVASISPPISLTEEMRASLGPRPERMFRLAGPCIASKCANWEGDGCGLIGRMRQEVGHVAAAAGPEGALPCCGIRAACVWWRQDGPDACRVCPYVTYNPSS